MNAIISGLAVWGAFLGVAMIHTLWKSRGGDVKVCETCGHKSERR